MRQYLLTLLAVFASVSPVIVYALAIIAEKLMRD